MCVKAIIPPRKALKKHTVPRVSPVKICARCKQPMPADRYHNARYCVACSTLQRKDVQRRHDKKRAAARREKTKTPEYRAANRKAVAKYSKTEKGKAAKIRSESKPQRIHYKDNWARDNKPVFVRVPDGWDFAEWMDKIVAAPAPSTDYSTYRVWFLAAFYRARLLKKQVNKNAPATCIAEALEFSF